MLHGIYVIGVICDLVLSNSISSSYQKKKKNMDNMLQKLHRLIEIKGITMWKVQDSII